MSDGIGIEARGLVVQGIDLIPESVALRVDLGPFNLDARSNPGISREGLHQARVLGLHLQVWADNTAKQLRPLPEELGAVLRPEVRMPAHISLVMQFDRASLEYIGEPFDDPAVCHRNYHDGVHGFLPGGPYSSGIDGPVTIDQAGDVGPVLHAELEDRIDRRCGDARGADSDVPSAVVPLLCGPGFVFLHHKSIPRTSGKMQPQGKR